MTVLQLFLYRHGATEANLRREYLGHRDLPLAQEGRAELMGKEIPDADLLFCSPLKRCLETAEIFFPGKEYILLPEWMERDFGPYEGKRWNDLKEQDDYIRWIDSEGEIEPDGMEPTSEFRERIRHGFVRIEKESLNFLSDESSLVRVAAVVHGGTILEFNRLLFPERPFYTRMPEPGESCRYDFVLDEERFCVKEDSDV